MMPGIRMPARLRYAPLLYLDHWGEEILRPRASVMVVPGGHHVDTIA